MARLYLLERAGAQSGTVLIGYCACWRVLDELHINSLAVAPEFHRQGHARSLLLGVFRDVVGEGVVSATLEVRRSNGAALGLYQGLGFTIDAVRPNYYQRPVEDALILWNRNLGTAETPTDSDGN